MKRTPGPALKRSTREGDAGARWSKAKTRNGKSLTGSNARSSPRLGGATTAGPEIERLLEREEWDAARSLIVAERSRDPDNHWLLTRLATTYYEQRKYRQALKYGLAALALQPQCPLVLWEYAGALTMLGREEEALGVYQQLLGRDFEALAYGECGEGYDWTLQLLNDCHYRMGRCYARLGDVRSAQLSYLKHLHNRSHGVASIYPVEKVEKALTEVSPGLSVANLTKRDSNKR